MTELLEYIIINNLKNSTRERKWMKDLMRKIKHLITEEAKKINKDEPIFEEKFFDLVNEIEANLTDGEDWLKQEKENGFTVSAAESEGYVKALRQVKETYIDFLKETEENKKVT